MKTAVNIMLSFFFGSLGSIELGYILGKNWNWFAVPALAVPTLTTGQAIGISFVFSCLTAPLHFSVLTHGWSKQIQSGDIEKLDENKALIETFVVNLLKLLVLYPIMLLVSYIWHQFI